MTSGLLDTAFKSLKQVKKELTTVAQLAVEEHEDEIIAKNQSQLFSGTNSQGESLDAIGGAYSERTVEIKKFKGQPYDRTTLYDTGDFYEDFFVKAGKTIYQIDSKDEKRKKLVKRYGKDIFGNTEEDEQRINDELILPELIDYCLDNIEL